MKGMILDNSCTVDVRGILWSQKVKLEPPTANKEYVDSVNSECGTSRPLFT